jgi:hypothetical protein
MRRAGGVGAGELAHVDAERGARRCRRGCSARALGELGLAGAGRAGEEEHAPRAGVVGEARADALEQVDHGARRVVLAEDAARDLGEEVGLVVGGAGLVHEQVALDAGAFAQGVEDLPAREVLVPLLGFGQHRE